MILVESQTRMHAMVPPPIGAAPSARAARKRPLPPTARQRSIGALASAGLRGAEWLYCMAAIFLLSGALVPLLLRESATSTELNDGNPLVRGLFLGVYAVMMIFLLLRWKSVLRIALRGGLILLLVTCAGLSVLWSIDPDTTLRRGAALLLTTSFGWYLAARYGTRSLLRLFAWSLAATLVASLAVSVAMPELGVHAGLHEGAWRGVFAQKNLLGKAAALAALFFAVLWRTDRRRSVVAAAGFCLSVFLVLMARSLTPLVALIAVLAISPFIGALRWKSSARAPVLAGGLFLAGAAALLIASNFEAAMLATGRDPTLTGRTGLWQAILEIGGRRPITGAGYGAFWSSTNPEVALVQDDAGWRAYGAHNGILDLWLELGAVGLALFLAAAGLAIRRSLTALRASQSPEAVWPILLISFILLTSLAEGGILRQNNLLWVMFVVAAAAPARPRPRDRTLAAAADE